MSEKLAKENHNIGRPFSGVVTAYTLHQLSSSLQLMSMVRFSLRQYPRFIAMQRSSGWRDVMGIAAIDCAQEENMPTCREYEVTSTKAWITIWKSDLRFINFRWWGTPASSSSHREPLQGIWGRRGLVGTSQFLPLRWSNGVGDVMMWDLNVIPPERHGGLPEGAAGEEGEGRERLAQSPASRVSQKFAILKS